MFRALAIASKEDAVTLTTLSSEIELPILSTAELSCGVDDAVKRVNSPLDTARAVLKLSSKVNNRFHVPNGNFPRGEGSNIVTPA